MAAKTVFDKTFRSLVDEFGTGPMDDLAINAAGRRMFGRRWGGVGSANASFPAIPDRFFVLNTDPASKPGVHWVGMYRSPRGQVYAFDSYARSIRRLIPAAARRAEKEGRGPAADANAEAVQTDNSDICGQLSLAWLNAVRVAGITETNQEFVRDSAARSALRAQVAL